MVENLKSLLFSSHGHCSNGAVEPVISQLIDGWVLLIFSQLSMEDLKLTKELITRANIQYSWKTVHPVTPQDKQKKERNNLAIQKRPIYKLARNLQACDAQQLDRLLSLCLLFIDTPVR